jgi:hypothetical protein
VWQVGQVFPSENIGYLSAVMFPKFRFEVNYCDERGRDCFGLAPRNGNESSSMSRSLPVNPDRLRYVALVALEAERVISIPCISQPIWVGRTAAG